MPSSIDGKVVRALGKLANDPEDVGRDPTAYVNVRPAPAGDVTVCEVSDGRGYLRVESRGAVDEAVLLDRDVIDHALADDELHLDGNSLRLGLFSRALERSDGSTPAQVKYPECEGHRLDPAARVAFSIAPKRLSNFLAAIAALEVKSVEVLLPAVRGGPIGFRGERKNGGAVEGIMVAESLFNATAADVGDNPEPMALPAPMLGLPAPDPLAGPAKPGDPLPFTPRFRCMNDAVVMWWFEDSRTVAACETHREELTPEGFSTCDVLQPGAAKCEHVGASAAGPDADARDQAA